MVQLIQVVEHTIALTGEKEGKNVEWLELVSDEEYENALKEARE